MFHTITRDLKSMTAVKQSPRSKPVVHIRPNTVLNIKTKQQKKYQ